MATYAKVVTESASGEIAQDTTGNAATATTASAAPYSGLTGSVPTWNQSTTGNATTATTATALATAGTVAIAGDITASGVTYSGGGNVSLSASVDNNVLDPGNLKGPSSSALANGTLNQVLSSAGNGTFKWTTQSSANNSTMTLSAGTGLSGGGSFTGNQASGSTVSFGLDMSELSVETTFTSANDSIPFHDDGAGADKRAESGTIPVSFFNNDSGFTTNTGTVTSVGTGKGLSGTVTGSGTINLNLGNLDVLSSFSPGNAMMGDVDMLIGYDDSGSKAVQIGYNKIDLGFFSNSIGYTLNAIESVSITAGNGLTGGGSATSGAYSKTLAVGAGTGVTVAADTVSIGQSVATSASPTFNNMTLSGDLTVSGTTITTNTETLEIGDNKMVLNAGHTGSAVDTGLVIERGSSGNNQMLFWDETQSSFCVGNNSSTAFPSTSSKIALQKVTSSLDSNDTSVPVGGMQVAGGVLFVRTA